MSTDILTPDDMPQVQKRLALIQSQFKKPVLKTSTGMHIEGQTKFVVHQMPTFKRHTELEIIALSDVQYGHKNCRVDKLIEYRDWILEKPYRFCLFVGDMIDAWRVNSPGFGYDNLWKPESQVYKFCELMAPIQHRILGSVGGNHERRGLAGGVDLGTEIAEKLNLPYSAGGQMISLSYSDHQPFKIYLWHGTGASRTAGARVNMTLRALPNDEAQAYVSGHIHHAHVYPGWHARRNYKRMEMEYERYYVISAGHFLRFWGSYAEVAGMTHSGLIMPVLLLGTNGRYRVEI